VELAGKVVRSGERGTAVQIRHFEWSWCSRRPPYSLHASSDEPDFL
jgi:hypothetical protein